MTPIPAGWKPIESAPKTGRTLLLGYWNSHGKWRTVRGQWMSAEYIGQEWDEPDGVEAGWFETAVEADDLPNCWPVSPTHWQPMPAPPCATCNEVGAVGNILTAEPCQDCSPASVAPGDAQDERRYQWPTTVAQMKVLAAELIRATEIMGGDDEESLEVELVLAVAPAATVQDDDGDWNAKPILTVRLEEYPEEGVYPIDPCDPTGGRVDPPAPAAGDARDAKRYRTWRDAMVAEDTEFRLTVAAALPGEVGDTRPPTSAEWDAGIDAAIAAQQGKGDGT